MFEARLIATHYLRWRVTQAVAGATTQGAMSVSVRTAGLAVTVSGGGTQIADDTHSGESDAVLTESFRFGWSRH